jgi:predicted O-methyltransferase YrrM
VADIRQVRTVIARLVDEGAVAGRSDGKLHDLFPVAIPAREGEALREWVRRENAASTIEVGLGYGISALFICDGLLSNGHAGARHVAMDPNQHQAFSDIALQVIQEAGLGDIVEFHAERSEIALPRFLAEGRRFDLAFVDGDHRFDASSWT